MSKRRKVFEVIKFCEQFQIFHFSTIAGKIHASIKMVSQNKIFPSSLSFEGSDDNHVEIISFSLMRRTLDQQ